MSAPTPYIKTLTVIRGRTVGLSCELDGSPAPDGRAYVTIEVDLDDARKCPLNSVVNLNVPTRDEHIARACATASGAGDS